MKNKTATTKHTCGGPIFGKLAPVGSCPRCDEMHNGAKPVKGWGAFKKEMEARHFLEIKNHNCKARGCGPVCTFGDW